MSHRLFQFSGVVPVGGVYITRPADSVYLEALESFEPVHVHGSRQVGKSSLLLHAKTALRERYAVASVDAQALLPSTPTATAVVPAFGGAVAAEFGLSRTHWHAYAQTHGLGTALGDLLLEVGRPAILLVDELDLLPEDCRHDIGGALRALWQMQAYKPGLKVNISLCGVEPPLGHFNESPTRDTREIVPGTQLWLDDFICDETVAKQIRRAFRERLDPPLDLKLSAALALLEYSGGYPQATSWLANLVVQHLKQRDLGEGFSRRLRQLARDHVAPAAGTPADVHQQRVSDTGWMRTTEKYLLEHRADARAAIDVYDTLLTASDRRPAEQVPYRYGARSHELLRLSGLARLDNQSLRTRCPLFEEVFDAAWVLDTRRRLELPQSLGSDPPPAPPPAPPRRRARPPRREERRLLVIGAGGTIGMAYNESGDVVPLMPGGVNWMDALQEHLSVEPLYRKIFDYDSADVGPVEWARIVKTIIQDQNEIYGVLVAHGTDTMAYTASAVAFALGRELSFPVVFTGSQTTVNVRHGDAVDNILRAALVAAQDLPEVVVVFGERIFRAVRTQKKDDLRFDAFESPGYPELGFVAEDVQIFDQNLLRSEAGSSRSDAAIDPGAADTSQRNYPPLTGMNATTFSSRILHVAQTPGSEAAFYQAAMRVNHDGHRLCKAMIVQSLGAGNVPWRTAEFDLTSVIREANAMGIPVVLTSQYPVFPANYLRYKPSAKAIEAGAIPTGNMTVAAVVAKLSWVIPQVDYQIAHGLLDADRRVERFAEMMGREYIGEGGLTIVDSTDEHPSEAMHASSEAAETGGA